jgi:2-methylcitrate dehydratase PrpD
VIDGLGDQWRIGEITLRMWPAAASLQSILTIVDRNDMIDAKEIESVTVRLPPANFAMNADIGWRSTFEATLSARYVTALALIRGGLWLEDFEAESLNDPEVDGFARTKVQVVSDDSVADSGAGLTITPTHGAAHSFEQSAPLGSPEHPALWDDVSAKFRRCAAGRLDEAAIDEVISRVGTLENEVSIQPLMQLLRCKGAG